MHDFDRILNLAQKTNSRLIVYDREGENHVVVMGLDEFEELVGSPTPPKPPVPPRPPHDHEAERDRALIEALNQEIAEWRAKAQQQETESTTGAISQEVVEEPAPTPTIPPAPSTSWHKFGDVLAGVYQTEQPKMPEVRYEPTPSPVAERTEPLDDDPIFLEEPVE